jgi:hypothetical protein
MGPGLHDPFPAVGQRPQRPRSPRNQQLGKRPSVQPGDGSVRRWGHVSLLLTTVTALCAWIVLWSIGVSAVDAFMPVPVLVIVSVMLGRVGHSGLQRGGPVNRRRTARGAPPRVLWRALLPRRRADGNIVGAMARAWIAAVVLAVAGFGLWLAALATTTDEPARLSELGSGLLSAAVVAFAVFFLERMFERRSRLESLRVTIGLQRDLTGIDLAGEYLAEFSFQGKTLTGAELSRADLRKARFGHADLEEARLIGCALEKAIFSGAKLAGSSFAAADITGAIFTDALDVDRADFATAYFHDEPPRFSVGQPAGIVHRPR